MGCWNSWKPLAGICGKTSYSWKRVCFEFTASCCLFRSTRLCGTSTLNYNTLRECGNTVSCFRCAVCMSRLVPFLSVRGQTRQSSCWFFTGTTVNNIFCELSNMRLCNISFYWLAPLFGALSCEGWLLFLKSQVLVEQKEFSKGLRL